MYDGEFLCDSIDAEWGREGISHDKAAPDSVATESTLVYRKKGCGYGLSPYLLRLIIEIYWFYVLDIIMDIGYEIRRITTT